MKIKTFFLLISFAGLLTSSSCHKDVNKKVHVVNLLNKSLDEIRAEIAGTWKLQYDSSNGFGGPMKNIPVNGEYRYYSFLTNDTIKLNINGNILVYQKATITKGHYPPYPNDVYIFWFGAGAFAWVMDQKRNDTLIIENGYLSGGGERYYLTKYP